MRIIFSTFLFCLWVAGSSTFAGELTLKDSKVDIAPLRFQESQTTTTGKTVITGPGGSRTITQDDSQKAAEILNRQTHDTTSDVTVTGVSNPGINVERRVYDMRSGGAPVIGNGPTDPQTGKFTAITGGPGSVHTESHSTTTNTPSVRVILGR